MLDRTLLNGVLALACISAPPYLPGQPGPKPDRMVRLIVSVRDGAGTPVSAVRLQVEHLGGRENEQPSLGVTLQTDVNGRAETVMSRAKHISIVATRVGYVDATGGYRTPSRGVTLSVSPDAPEVSTDIVMERSASLAAVVVDAETKRPLEGVSVAALRQTFLLGKSLFLAHADMARTNALGRFRFSDLPPGDYLLRLSDRVPITINAHESQHEPQSNEKHSGTTSVMKGYGLSMYPPGLSISSVDGLLRLEGAQDLDLGNLYLLMQPLYQVAVRLNESDCVGTGGLSVSLRDLSEVMSSAIVNAEIPCRGFLLRNVPSGTYGISAWSKPRDPIDRRVLDEIVTIRRSATISLSARTLTALNGRIAVDGGDEAMRVDGLASVRVWIRSSGQTLFGSQGPVPVSANGSFRCVVQPGQLHRLHVYGLPEGWYVKSFKYYGADVLPDTAFEVRAAAMQPNAEVVVSPASARLALRPATKSAPTAIEALNAIVIRSELEHSEQLQTMIVLQRGNAEYDVASSLAPGVYKVFYIPPRLLGLLHRPGGLEKYLAQAVTVRLGARESKIVDDVSLAR